MAFEPFNDNGKVYTPQFSIEVGSGMVMKKVKVEDFPIIDLNVVMSADYDMSSCEFTIAGIFDPKNSKFKHKVYDTFKPGKVVDVKVGYNKLNGVFKGYINALSFDFNGQGGPYITVQCLDAKGALVNNKTWKNYGAQPLKSVILSILNEKCSKYAKIVDVDSDFDKSGGKGGKDVSPEIKESMDDYNYVIHIAKKTNNSFCVLYDKLHFCENLTEEKDIIGELKWGRNLLSFAAEINLSKQVGVVQVYGDNPASQQTFSAKASSGAGAGDSGAEIASVVKSKTMVIRDPDVKNQTQANERAKHALAAFESKLVTCKGSTIGIPEIVAGKKIEVSGMDKGINGIYFLNHVTHRINGNGYITSFDGSSPVVK